MAITALKLGSTLPIIMSPQGLKPKVPQYPLHTPEFDIQVVRSLCIPYAFYKAIDPISVETKVTPQKSPEGYNAIIGLKPL
jgi:hypothetical protein